MRVALAQVDPILGDVDANLRLVEGAVLGPTPGSLLREAWLGLLNRELNRLVEEGGDL